jgi:hypothetical protein
LTGFRGLTGSWRMTELWERFVADAESLRADS